MRTDDGVSAVGPRPLRRFWHTALGFGRGKGSWVPWTLIGLLILCVVAQLLVQYRLNIWNRDFFDALEKRNGTGIRHQTYLLPGLAACSIFLAAFAVWARMTFQRRWRGWLTAHLVGLWLEDGNYRRLEAGSDEPQLAEYRIAEDARIATDAPRSQDTVEALARTLEHSRDGCHYEHRWFGTHRGPRIPLQDASHHRKGAAPRPRRRAAATARLCP